MSRAVAVIVLAFAVSAQAGTLQTLHTFTDVAHGTNPIGSLIKDEGGNLYGATIYGGASGGGTVYRVSPDGTHTILHSFGSSTGGGGHPYAGVVRDSQGNFFGMAADGGAHSAGVVFKLAPDGTYTVIHDFGDDGTFPEDGLIIDRRDHLFGMASHGGHWLSGAVFEITPKNKFNVLYTFRGRKDGSWPAGEPVKDKEGNLYGSASEEGPKNYGEVFKLAPDGTKTVLHAFRSGDDGWSPMGPLILDKNGTLYGTVYGGGAGGLGTIFRIDAAGKFKVIYSVTRDTGGAGPDSGVVMDKTGALYGALPFGGDQTCEPGCGALFKIAPDGTFSIIHAFTGHEDGGVPNGLLLDAQGNLYGTTSRGGSQDHGTVFVLRP